MFRDAPGLLFAQDGLSPDFVRAGEPRVRRYETRDAVAPERAPARRRASFFDRLLRPVSS